MNLDVSSNSSFNLILNIFMVILGSILIPSLLSITRKSEPQGNKMNRGNLNRFTYRRRIK